MLGPLRPSPRGWVWCPSPSNRDQTFKYSIILSTGNALYIPPWRTWYFSLWQYLMWIFCFLSARIAFKCWISLNLWSRITWCHLACLIPVFYLDWSSPSLKWAVNGIHSGWPYFIPIPCWYLSCIAKTSLRIHVLLIFSTLHFDRLVLLTIMLQLLSCSLKKQESMLNGVVKDLVNGHKSSFSWVSFPALLLSKLLVDRTSRVWSKVFHVWVGIYQFVF